jgi:hypothetical protein
MGKIVKINQIKPNPKNPRTIKDERFEKLKKSIQDFPDMLNKRPLVCFTATQSGKGFRIERTTHNPCR